MRTVDIVSSEMRHVRLGVRWNYFLKIPAKDVPLSHRVVIDVLTRDRIALGRCQQAWDSPARLFFSQSQLDQRVWKIQLGNLGNQNC